MYNILVIEADFFYEKIMKKLIYALLATTSLLMFNCNNLEDPTLVRKSPIVNLSSLDNDQSNGRIDASITNPTGGTFIEGNTMSIGWDFVVCGCGSDWSASGINIDIFNGNTFIQNVATNVPFYLFNFNWIIPYRYSVDGLGWSGTNNLKIKITSVNNSENVAYSGYFTIAKGTLPLAPKSFASLYDYWSNPNSVHLEFSYSERANYYELSYAINYDQSVWYSLGNTSQEHYFASVIPGVMYNFRIRSINQYGASVYKYHDFYGSSYDPN
jgi:hypothetical protein